MLGDNRSRSHDSPMWTAIDEQGREVPRPFVPFDHVEGPVTRIWLPLSRSGPVN